MVLLLFIWVSLLMLATIRRRLVLSLLITMLYRPLMMVLLMLIYTLVTLLLGVVRLHPLILARLAGLISVFA